jgi:hypothetical protein
MVTNVSPSFGSSLGGTTVTITGTGLTAVDHTTSVVINGVPCAVATVSATVVTCVTGVRPPPPDVPAPGFQVTVGTIGNAVLYKDPAAIFR